MTTEEQISKMKKAIAQAIEIGLPNIIPTALPNLSRQIADELGAAGRIPADVPQGEFFETLRIKRRTRP